MSRNKVLMIIWVVNALFWTSNHSCWAEEVRADSRTPLGFTLGGSYGLGSLVNTDMGLPSRTMSTFSLEALPGYWLGSVLLGIDFQYQWEGQLTGLSDTIDTNLRGSGYYFGIGANYRLNGHWALQGGVVFLGKYNFTYQTDQSLDSRLNGPLGIHLKAQYFLTEQWPLSADLSFQYMRFSTFSVATIDNNAVSSQWMAALGITYHLGSDRGSGSFSSPSSVSVPPPFPPAAHEQEPSEMP